MRYKAKSIIRDKEGHSVMIKDSIIRQIKQFQICMNLNNIISKYIKAKTEKTRRINRQIHNHSGRFQHTSLNK